MKWILLVFALAILTPSTHAEPEPEVKTKVSKKSTRKKAIRSLLNKKYYDFTAQYIVWQEKIDATGTGISGTGRFQFSGYQLGAHLNKPFKNIRWVSQYAAYFVFGTAKGNGESGSFADEFKNQSWMAGTLAARLNYRTSASSELGITLPLTVRAINWALADNATIELEKEMSFSAGLGFQFIQRFSLRSSLVAGVTHQFIWDATQWNIGYQYSLH